MTNPFLIGIAGASCSGKTTVAALVAEQLGGACHISLDSYYHDLSHMPEHAIGHHNLDEPAALDSALLIEQMGMLAAGRAIARPVYDHRTHTRATEPEMVEPVPFVIVEGLFALYWQELRRHLGTGIFIDASHDVCLDRRIRRDRNQRGRTVEEVTRRYREMVAPMFDRYVLPTREFADLVVDGHSDIEAVVTIVLEHTRRTSGGSK